jgi:hypothetical protein
MATVAAAIRIEAFMSSPLVTPTTPSAEFQAHFGAPPGLQDARHECEKWERLCAALLEERSRLQAELAKATAKHDADLKALCAFLCKEPKFDLTMDQVYAQVEQDTSLEQIISELENEAKKKP